MLTVQHFPFKTHHNNFRQRILDCKEINTVNFTVLLCYCNDFEQGLQVTNYF